MKVLITHPHWDDPGGVAQYYGKLKNKFKFRVHHFIIGKQPAETGSLSAIRRLMQDYFRFFLIIGNKNIKIVHLNPSLDSKSLLREGILIVISKIVGKKIVVFFRGWGKKFEANLEKKYLKYFMRIFGKVDSIIVLSSEAETKLQEWGFKQPIYREVTVIDDQSVRQFIFDDALKKRKNAKVKKILFLSRIIKQKGVYETIDAIKLLNSKYSHLELVIAGDGPELKNVKAYVKYENLENVMFTGYAQGDFKNKLFIEAYLFCFPSYYGEGMPNAFIESMAFGLPVVTRMVGGIPDIFKNGRNGFGTLSKEPRVIAKLIENILTDSTSYETICRTNYEYAQTHFLASQAAARLERIYSSLL